MAESFGERAPDQRSAREKQAEMRRMAMNWLARRDYSRLQIEQKLVKKCASDAASSQCLIQATLDWLEEQNFLDDQRYCDAFVRSRVERGHGFLRIRQELQQKGVGIDQLQNSLDENPVDWFALALSVRERRFGLFPCGDQKEKARQLRFLQYRGFSAEQCFYALEAEPEQSDMHLDNPGASL